MALLRNVTTSADRPALQGEVFFGLFDKYIKFLVADVANIDYVTRCAVFLNSMSGAIIDDLCTASIRYCDDFLSHIGQAAKGFANPREVLGLIYPSTLIVPNPENGSEPIVHMELNCEWEPEHGMEWIVRGERVLYVGAFEGQDPWAVYSQKDTWNYA